METTVQPTTSKEIVSAKVNVALTKVQLGFQELSNLSAKLIFNEDNLTQIAEVMAMGRKMKKIIEDEHKVLKDPYLREGQIIDESRRTMVGEVDNLTNPVSEKYTKLCEDIERKKKAQQLEEQRKQLIQEGIGSNMIKFSTWIAACKTLTSLREVEAYINLEKSYKKKYQEFYDVAVEKYNSLTTLLKIQKENIIELEKLEKKQIDAEAEGNDEKSLQLQEMQESLINRIEEKKVEVQEKAIEQSAPIVQSAREVFTTVTARRKAWTYEVEDIDLTAKKMKAWVTIEPNGEKISEFMKASKEQWEAENKDSVVINGVKFFIKKTY